MKTNPTFQNDQYFYLSRSKYKAALDAINNIVDSETLNTSPYEKKWVPDSQVHGEFKKIGLPAFIKIQAIFDKDILPDIETNTALVNMELIAVRKNELSEGQYVEMHSDSKPYVLFVDLLESEGRFCGGHTLFTKDSGEVVEVDIERDEVLIAKCTNDHGVSRVTRGTRESLVLFAMPKST